MIEQQLRTLNNGIRLATARDASAGVVSLLVGFRAGSIDEQPKARGTAHFLEHMAFKGTSQFGPTEIAEQIEAKGADLNATTSLDETVYELNCLAEDVDWGLNLIADLLLDLAIASDEFDRERRVILNELADAADDPGQLLGEGLYRDSYPNSPWGLPVAGTSEGVAELIPHDLRQFMASHYSAERMLVAVAGPVSPDDFAKLIETRFTNLPQQRPSAVITHKAPIFRPGRTQRSAPVEQVHLGLMLEASGFQDDELVHDRMLAWILGGGAASLLFREIREKRGLAYSTSAELAPYQDFGSLTLYTTCRPDDRKEVEGLMEGTLNTLAGNLTAQELERTKHRMRASLKFASESQSSRVQRIFGQVMRRGRIISDDELIRQWQAVTLDDLRNRAASLATQERRNGASGAVHGKRKKGSRFHFPFFSRNSEALSEKSA